MFTTSLLFALGKLAIPALTAVLSVSLSKYLDSKDKKLLATLAYVIPLAGMFLFYVIPQLDNLASGVLRLLDIGDLTDANKDAASQPAPDATSTGMPVADTAARHDVYLKTAADAHLKRTMDEANKLIKEYASVPHGEIELPSTVPHGKFHVDLPYIDYIPEYKPLDTKPLINEFDNYAAKQVKPVLDALNNMQLPDPRPAKDFAGMVTNGWDFLKDILLR